MSGKAWRVRALAGVLASALLAGLYAKGGAGWMLGFVALVPWLLALDASASLGRTLLAAWAFSVAFTLGAFHWFGAAIGVFTQIGEPAGLALLLVAAPLFQPQLLAFALARRLATSWAGRGVGASAAAAAWVATEWLGTKLLGDTLGHGLYPQPLLRQAAELGGAAGLTVMLLLANEALAAAIDRRRQGARAVALPLALAALVPALLAASGWALRGAAPAAGTPTLRLGLVQSAIVDYERLRREKGSGAVVREVLDTHYAMTYDAVERQRAQAVLWSETVYPTTFGQPKSEAGAELDREIQQIVDAAGVPFVFGTYDRDDAGEYNAAAFVAPRSGLLGFYRKTRLFPFTEAVPGWLDSAALRRWLPWTGRWRPGSGARVLPLRLADGREVPALPLICLDDVDPMLAIAGARLGAAVILTMSNDSWFTAAPQGAELHLAVAAFRSIETRLPQFRVTSNGTSAVIDAGGAVIAGTRMGERTLVIGEVPLVEPRPTLMVRWGDWVGAAATGWLLLLVVWAAVRAWHRHCGPASQRAAASAAALPPRAYLLPPAVRVAASLLRGFAMGSLLWMAAAALWGDGGWMSNTFGQIRLFALLFVLPEAAARCLLMAYAARPELRDGQLLLARGSRRIELAVSQIAAVSAWRLPAPCAGATLRLAAPGQRSWHLAGVDAVTLSAALAAAGGSATLDMTDRRAAHARAQQALRRGLLDRAWAKFGLLPLLLAVPAFQLHQQIAYGAAFGEAQAFGWLAFAKGFALWWAAWVIAAVVCAAVLRAAIEAAALAATALRPEKAVGIRNGLENAGRALLWLGLPVWLLSRALGA